MKGYICVRGVVSSDALPGVEHLWLISEGCRYRLTFFGYHSLSYGDRVRVCGFAFMPYLYKNPGSFQRELYLKREGICGYMKVTGYEVLERGSGFLKHIHSLRIYLIKRVAKFPEPLRFFTLGMVLGVKELVPSGEREYFYRLGLGHLFAVSGFHFGIILGLSYAVLLFAMRVLNLFVKFPFSLLPSKSAHILNLFVLPFLFVITGSQLSALRASIMYVIFVVLHLFERDTSLYRIAFWAFVVMFLSNPLDITGAGFEYTFAAVFTIAFIIERFRHLSYVKSFILISVAVSLALIPITAFHFHRVYPLSVVSNILFLPLFSVFIPFLIFNLCFTLLSGSHILIGPANSVAWVIYSVVKHLSSIRWAELWVTRTETVVVAAVPFFLFYFLSKRRVFLLISGLVVCVAVCSFYLNRRDRAVFFDLGKRGNASLVVHKGFRILVDAGGRGALGGKELVSALLWQDVKSLDKVFLTSPSKDSSAYLPYLKRVIKVKSLVKAFTASGDCRDVVVADICFLCPKGICHCRFCRIKNGPVVVKGKVFYPWKAGAITVRLED